MPLLIAALGAAVLLSFVLSLVPITDPDIWWHLRTGRLILEKGIPKIDPFSYTAQGRPWVTHEWLSEVLFYRLEQIGGSGLLVVLTALLASGALALSAAAAITGPRARERFVPAALGVLLAAPVLADRAFVRPHMFTALLIGATLLLLRMDRGAGGSVRYRIALLPLFLLWANLHSGFVLGLALVALFWAGAWIDDRSAGGARSRHDHGALRKEPAAPRGLRLGALWSSRTSVLVLAFLVTLINPHHVNAFLYPIRLMGNGEIRNSIVELRSIFHPDYRGGLFLAAILASAGALAVVLLGTRGRVRWALLLPGIAFGVLGARSVRGMTEFAVLLPALIGIHGEWIGKRRSTATAVASTVLACAVLGGAAAAHWGIPMGRGTPRRLGTGVNDARVPDEAVAFLRVAAPRGRVFNVMGFGGYLLRELWPERQVYIDGRLDVYPPGFLSAYGRLMSTGDGWDEACRKYGITIAVLDYPLNPTRDAGLRAKLRSSPDWACVFFGRNLLIYARRVAENEAMLDRYGCPFDPSFRSPESIWSFAGKASPLERDRAIASMSAMSAVAPGDGFLLVSLGEMLDACGRSEEGAERIRAAIRLGGDSPEARILLAGALTRAGKFDDARGEIGSVLTASPRRIDALITLADCESAAGNGPEARKVLERASGIDPGNRTVQARLARLGTGQ